MEKVDMMAGIGIPKLDERLRLPENGNILVIGPPGMEKMAVAFQFIGSGLANKQNGIFITTDMAPEEIENRGGDYGWRLFSYTDKSLYFVDCYSWTLGSALKSKRADTIVPGPSALNDLSIGITQAMQKAFKQPSANRAVFQSISTLLLYNNPEIAFRFVQITGARMKSAGASTMFLLESGMHEEKAVTTLKHLMDGYIEIKNEGGKWMLTAPQNGLNEWIPFKVGKDGVEV
jgi:KaiC/GvpD/RAD55 family RecA-like ATPase